VDLEGVWYLWIQNVADSQQKGLIEKVLSWQNRVFAAIWNAISALKRVFSIATETALAIETTF